MLFILYISYYNRQSEALAKERGCSHTFVLATGKYSAAVFDKLGHTLVEIFLSLFYFNRSEKSLMLLASRNYETHWWGILNHNCIF